MGGKYSNETDEQFRNRMFSGSGGMSGTFTGQPLPATQSSQSYSNPFGDELPLWQKIFPAGPSSNYGQVASPTEVKDEGFGWNSGTANMISAGLGGIGNLARGWAAIKGLGIAKDQLEENKRQYNQNYAQQLRAFEADRTRANTRISDQNAWKTAQGRTDLGSLIV